MCSAALAIVFSHVQQLQRSCEKNGCWGVLCRGLFCGDVRLFYSAAAAATLQLLHMAIHYSHVQCTLHCTWLYTIANAALGSFAKMYGSFAEM